MTHHLPRQSGRLTIGGVDLDGLCTQHGTPLFVYDAQRIRDNAQRLLGALPDRIRVHYSVKANPSVAVIALLRSCGLGAEIASDGELVAALAAGHTPSDIIFAGPGKTDAELARAICTSAQPGVACINCESTAEVARVGAIASDRGVVQPVALRINPGASTSNGRIPTGGGPQKFGIDEDQAAEAINAARSTPGVRLVGYHVYTASQVHDSDALLREHANALAMLRGLSEETGFAPESINLGGGIGVPHSNADPAFDLDAYGRGLGALLDEHCSAGALSGAGVVLEPGRMLVSDAGVYLTRVLDVKASGPKHQPVTHAITDGGINHALLPITANTYQAALVVEHDQRDEPDAPPPEPVIIGGPLCTSVDQWRSSVPLPGVRVGDVVALFNSGAYGLTAGMTMFLSRAAPAEILVDGGEARVIRQRATLESVLDRQIVPAPGRECRR
jgi:diaminopimelate decarboxylase